MPTPARNRNIWAKFCAAPLAAVIRLQSAITAESNLIRWPRSAQRASGMPNTAKETVNASPDNRPMAVSLNPRSRRIGSISTENMIRSMELERLTILRMNKSLILPLFMSGTHLESRELGIWPSSISERELQHQAERRWPVAEYLRHVGVKNAIFIDERSIRRCHRSLLFQVVQQVVTVDGQGPSITA